MIWAAWSLSVVFTKIVPDIQVVVFIVLATVGSFVILRMAKFYTKFVIAWHFLPRTSFHEFKEVDEAAPAAIQGKSFEVDMIVDVCDEIVETSVVPVNRANLGTITTATGVGGNDQEEEEGPTICDIEQDGPKPDARPGLLAGWVEYMDPATGNPYYHNVATNETTWTHPTSSEIFADAAANDPLENYLDEMHGVLNKKEPTCEPSVERFTL